MEQINHQVTIAYEVLNHQLSQKIVIRVSTQTIIEGKAIQTEREVEIGSRGMSPEELVMEIEERINGMKKANIESLKTILERYLAMKQYAEEKGYNIHFIVY